MDVVGGFVLADGRRAKALTGVDDHSRFCVSAYLMLRESSRERVRGAGVWRCVPTGCPEQILTDNGKVFTGRFNQPPVEVLFDRICRENGIEHLLTQPRSPTTTGKIERFHRALRTEFRTDRVFADLAAAQAELDEWVARLQHTTGPTRRWTWPPRPHGSSRPSPAPVTPLRVRPPALADPARPRRRDLGRPPSQRRRGGVRELATGLPRRRRRRPQHRRLGHRPGPAVLRRRPPAAHPEADHPGGERRHRRRRKSRRVSPINRSRSAPFTEGAAAPRGRSRVRPGP